MIIYWIWLSHLKYVCPVLQKKLLDHFRTSKAVYDATEEELLIIPRISKKAIQSIQSSRSLKEAEALLKSTRKAGVDMLTFDDKHYPHFASEYKESPILLFYKGNLQPLETTVGVVGARRCTAYGKRTAEKIGEELADLNIPLISGFAKGIDSYAQASCVKNNGYTIGFLGNGPDICYPQEQEQLSKKILNSCGAFISQYPPGTPPNPRFFPARNALISAWSTELVIVEAGEKSGALMTADFAKKNNRRILAVPNQIDVQEGAGTNYLLSRGIPPYLGIQSLISANGKIKTSLPSKTTSSNSPILQTLSESPKTIIQLIQQLKLEKSELIDLLMDLELDQKIILRGNMVYLLK